MKKVMMVILDGFGISTSETGNAVKETNMDCFNELYSEYPNSILQASGDSIGLPDDQAGDAEVCHLTIGAGKKVKQDITLCNEILGSTLIEHNEKLLNIINKNKDLGGNIHLAGLVSDGGLHSDITYMKNFLKHLKAMGARNIKFHAITDGKDTNPRTAITFLNEIQEQLSMLRLGNIATVCGRYYAMDRDEKFERTKVYSDLLINGKGGKIKSFAKGIEACYAKDIEDEYIVPIITDEDGLLKDNDTFIWLNFRSDRSRQILSALSDPNFEEYRIKKFKNFDVLSILPISGLENVDHLIDDREDIYSIGTYFSDLGLKQARIAEAERFNHVTFYFNGADRIKLKGCDNFLVEPEHPIKDIEKHPEMAAKEITKQAIKCMEKDYDFILVNYANPDLLAHTGNLEATKKGLEILDECLKELVEAVDDNFYKFILTSDHGNCDEMIDQDGNKSTIHSLNPVPFVLRDKHVNLKHKGVITQIAPTILKYMDIAIPHQMSETKTLFNEED